MPECDNMKDTELTLGLPGEPRMLKSGDTRRFRYTDEMKLVGRSSSAWDSLDRKNLQDDESDNEISSSPKTPPKGQVVGWPPVRSYRNSMTMKDSKYVKVAVDGAPYLRKVDLETYGSYQELLNALDHMLSCSTICNVLKKRKLIDMTENGIKYTATYKDKDGDWMLVGDVPWKMFVESCKRLRLMKSSEEIGLGEDTLDK